MKKTFTFITIMIALLCCFSLTGCSSDDFDAALLVKGNLDSIYLNSPSEEYLTLCETTKETCTENYEAGIQTEVDYFISFFDFDETMMTESTRDRITELYEDIYDHSKYEVGSVTKSDDDYLVSVTIYPIDIFEKMYDEDYNDFYLSYEEKYNSGVSAEELEAYWQNGILEMAESHLDSLGYLDPVTLSVQVTPVEETEDTIYYSISENDLVTIDENIIDYNF